MNGAISRRIFQRGRPRTSRASHGMDRTFGASPSVRTTQIRSVRKTNCCTRRRAAALRFKLEARYSPTYMHHDSMTNAIPRPLKRGTCRSCRDASRLAGTLRYVSCIRTVVVRRKVHADRPERHAAHQFRTRLYSRSEVRADPPAQVRRHCRS